MSSGPKRVPNPLPRASRREPAPSTTTDSATPATLQDSRSLDGGACPDADVLFVVGRKSLCSSMSSTYGPGGSAGKRSCPFSFVVSRRRTANQRRRADPDGGTRKDAALCILDGADEGSRQPLRGSHAGEHETRGDTTARGFAAIACRIAFRREIMLSRVPFYRRRVEIRPPAGVALRRDILV